MKRTIIVSLTLFLLTASLAGASVILTGDCDPALPGDWNSSVNGTVGTPDGTGSATIDGGSLLECNEAFIAMDGASEGAVMVSGAGSTLTAAGPFNVGEGGMGSLTVESGGVVNNVQGRIGHNADGVGTVLVTGSGSQWNNSDYLILGYYSGSHGAMTVTDYATVTNGKSYVGHSSGTTGTVTVSNHGTWNCTADSLRVGSSGTGTINIESGGVLNATKSIIAVYTGSVGNATITGAGSAWNTSGYMYLASKPGAKGTMTITDSAAVSNTKCYIGGYYSDAASATAAVTVSNNATWTNSSDFYVGYYGSATLDIESGGVVTATRARIGMKSGATGAMTVTGTGSAFNASDNLVIGWSGVSGTMTVTDGAAVSNTDGYIGYESGGTGSALISGGGVWNNNGSLNVGYRANGTMDVTDGGVVNSTVGRISYAAASTGIATITGPGSQWNIDSYLLIGRNDGTGTLNIENGGTVNVDGHVSLSQPGATGTLAINGGSLTTTTLYGDCANITGTGDIHANGLIADTTIVFDSTHGLVQDIAGIGATGGVTIHLDADGTGRMGVGYESTGSLTITDGIVLDITSSTLGYYAGSNGTVSVSGAGTEWNNTAGGLLVGYDGAATLSISDGALVSALGLTIDDDIGSGDEGAIADSSVNMSTGAMLALFADLDQDGEGDNLSASITDFLTAVSGRDRALQCWDEGSGNWIPFTTATPGSDYTLKYIASGDLTGYTMLTVVPEPSTLVLLLGMLALLFVRRIARN